MATGLAAKRMAKERKELEKEKEASKCMKEKEGCDEAEREGDIV